MKKTKDSGDRSNARRVSNQQARRSNSLRHQKRRRRRNHVVYWILICFLLTAGVVVSLRMFLKISEIRVEGESRYTAQEIVKASGLEKGANLFDFKTREVENKILNDHVYIEKVKVARQMPTIVAIEVTPVKELGAIKREDGFDIISTSGKILTSGAPYPPSDLPIIYGFSVDIPEEDDIIDTKAQMDKGLAILQQIIAAADSAGLEGITSIDMSNRLNMSMIYQGRIKIILGTEAQMEYKLRLVKESLPEVDMGAEGVMNVSDPGANFYTQQTIHPPLGALTSAPEETGLMSGSPSPEGGTPQKPEASSP